MCWGKKHDMDMIKIILTGGKKEGGGRVGKGWPVAESKKKE